MTDSAEPSIESRIQAQRERIVDEVKQLDALYVEKGSYAPRQPNDILTHCVVVTSWHRMESTGSDSTEITDYLCTDMARWQVLGLLEADVGYVKASLLEDDVDD